MSTISNDGNFQTFVVDNESSALREQLAERSPGSSPTRHTAADHSDIELVGRSQAFIATMKPDNPPEAASQAAGDEWVTLSEVEGRYVARVLEHTGGNKQAAARILAVDRKTLDRMIKRHNIDCPHTRRHS